MVARLSSQITGKIANTDWDDAVASNSLPLTGTDDSRIDIDQSTDAITIRINGTIVFKITASQIQTTLPINQVETIS